MASKEKESSGYTNFDEILKRGAATEPKNFRPLPQVVHKPNVKEESDMSLNGAVASNGWRNDLIYRGLATSEPRKKSNRRKKVGSNEESGFSSDGSPNQSRKRTPMTMPRTKITSATPLEQKIALKRLKQRLSFDDQQQETKKVLGHQMNGDIGDDAQSVESSNRASEHGESDIISEVDTEKVDERLDQVRDYIKQATGMYLSLSMDMNNDDPKKSEQLNKLGKLIQQLRVQEKGYLDLLQKTKTEDEMTSHANKVLEEVSANNQSSQNVELCDVAAQQQELERLREQQALLKKIVDQQKELQQLKERQSTLLAMQENAEQLIQEHRHIKTMNSEMQDHVNSESGNIPQEDEDELLSASATEASTTTSNNVSDSEDTDADNIQRRIELEHKLESLNEKKQQMDELMKTLKSLKDAHTAESNMKSVLNEDDLSEVASEFLAANTTDDDEEPQSKNPIRQKIGSLNDVRQKLKELKSIVNTYETASSQGNHQSVPNPSKDNRLHAQSMQEQQHKGNTVTGAGGARLRVQSNVNNQNVLMRDLQSLQYNIEELMDNRNRPIPEGIQRNQIDVTRNSSLKKKNTNQEKRQFRNASANSYNDQLRQLKNARKQVNKATGRGKKNLTKPINTDRPCSDNTTSEKDSDLESNSNSTLQWQDDPEFQNKVQKLKMAKEKLHHLQELVKVVQHGGGPNLPIDDLEDLTLTLSDEQIGSEYGESEEEEADEGDESDDEEEEEEEEEEDLDDEENFRRRDDGIESTGEQSDISKSTATDLNGNFASENGLSDNERRYQGLLRKQRLELNYLLKERERLLEAQRKLSDLAGKASDEEMATGYSSKKKPNSKKKEYPKLTKAELSKQGKLKKESKESTMRRLFPKLDVDEFYGSEHEIYPPEQAPSDFKQNIAAAISNPMAVSEIRRQRDMFEEKKKQKFVEKQRRKKLNQNDENQSEDRATYVINSDIDEGVGVSMYSADVTTAATWGGSTEQSSDEDDSAVGDEDDEDENVADDEYGSHYDQVEEEEETREGASSNVPSLFKVKKFDEEPANKKKSRGIGSVSWSLDVSPQKSRKRPRQGNLTPAHKLIHDNNNRRKQRQNPQEQQQAQQQLPIRKPALKPFEPMKSNQGGGEEVQSQLATICSSLLRNEQTLLQMLQNQMTGPNRRETSNVQATSSGMNSTVLTEIQDFFNSSNHNESYRQTLNSLRSAHERIEQHQLDMEFLRQQFERLGQQQPSMTNTPFGPSASDFQSPWPNPPSLHFSSFGAASNANAQEDIKPFFQKETQTETSLFNQPFKPSIQQYSLFGGAPDTGGDDQDFNINPLHEPTSPGVVGDRSFTHQDRGDDIPVEELFPYRLRISEYNPLSYQGNFANTMTGNTMTVSKMSMNKKNEESKSNDGNDSKSIWPSFFKMSDEKSSNENEESSKRTNDMAGNSGSTPKESTEHGPSSTGGATAADSTDGNSLFDALRDSIYSEVATLIAMNESRPHYLIELFRELQLLNSDYLRQRALYALQELVTRYLTDENVPSNASPSKGTAFTKEKLTGHPWVASGSEQTPSDLASVMTTTDDEGETEVLQTLKEQMQNNGMYDYAELADSQSDANVSTPGSHNDNPFAAEDLGNTVINLEDALHKSRFEHAQRIFGTNSTQSTPQQQAMYETIRRRVNANMDNVSTSSAGDVTSEASSDLQQPSIDTQKLDQQIKAVMIDLIPFLNENIDLTCNEEFLDKVRTLIVEYARQKEPGSEQEQFGRFFHTQLDSILRDSLIKFNSRKLKECGEDLLIDVSEILFNELAFFRLMQDLDRPGYGGAAASLPPNPQNGDQSKMPFVNRSTMYDDSSAAESTDVPPEQNDETEEEEEDDDEEEETEDEDLVPVTKPSNSSGASGSSSNAFVMIDSVTDDDDDDTESARQFVKVELSVSETRPVRSSGSGEEDQNEEEPATFSTVATPPSSIHTYSQSVGENNTDGDREVAAEDDRDEGDRDLQEDERSEHEREASVSQSEDNEGDEENPENETEDQRDLAEPESNLALAEPESSLALNSQDNRSPEEEATEGDQNQQAESSQQQNETEDDETEDDLPEADMVSDDSNHAEIVLAHIEGIQELAGDPNVLPLPSGSPRS